jgi:uncharacterized protein DUF397
VTETAWRKASGSDSGDDCVEIKPSVDEFHVRDSKNVSGPKLRFPSAGWQAFVQELRSS